MTSFGVRYESLFTGSEGLNAQERALLEKLGELRSELIHTAEGWSGEAKRAFDVNIGVFEEATLQFGAILGRTGNQLAEASAGYFHADTRASRAIQG
ncbi:WXG100 family type VII secretion target [Streptomyces avicenniae]|uniref:WXG100 family type VII secretion target n=1 Tax=Streptomyces avicenniae TaxID=500153 RepID=UPI00069A76FD|nr:hypothetical protein [Streptomyces avicenniae]